MGKRMWELALGLRALGSVNRERSCLRNQLPLDLQLLLTGVLTLSPVFMNTSEKIRLLRW